MHLRDDVTMNSHTRYGSSYFIYKNALGIDYGVHLKENVGRDNEFFLSLDKFFLDKNLSSEYKTINLMMLI